jgi:hypothetical protein
MILLHSFAPALFLFSRGFEPLSIERQESGAVEYAFADASRAALHEYSMLRQRLNELIDTTSQR